VAARDRQSGTQVQVIVRERTIVEEPVERKFIEATPCSVALSLSLFQQIEQSADQAICILFVANIYLLLLIYETFIMYAHISLLAFVFTREQVDWLLILDNISDLWPLLRILHVQWL